MGSPTTSGFGLCTVIGKFAPVAEADAEQRVERVDGGLPQVDQLR
jgi:hypothetical protein